MPKATQKVRPRAAVRKSPEYPPNPPLEYLLSLDPALLGRLVEILLAIADAKAPDPDAEDGDEDCCIAGDDIGSTDDRALRFGQSAEQGLALPGDPDDGEDDDPAEASNAQGFNSGANEAAAHVTVASLFRRAAR